MQDLMLVCCLWHAIKEPLRLHLGNGDSFTKLETMFQTGWLAFLDHMLSSQSGHLSLITVPWIRCTFFRHFSQNRWQFGSCQKIWIIQWFKNSDVLVIKKKHDATWTGLRNQVGEISHLFFAMVLVLWNFQTAVLFSQHSKHQIVHCFLTPPRHGPLGIVQRFLKTAVLHTATFSKPRHGIPPLSPNPVIKHRHIWLTPSQNSAHPSEARDGIPSSLVHSPGSQGPWTQSWERMPRLLKVGGSGRNSVLSLKAKVICKTVRSTKPKAASILLCSLRCKQGLPCFRQTCRTISSSIVATCWPRLATKRWLALQWWTASRCLRTRDQVISGIFCLCLKWCYHSPWLLSSKYFHRTTSFRCYFALGPLELWIYGNLMDY